MGGLECLAALLAAAATAAAHPHRSSSGEGHSLLSCVQALFVHSTRLRAPKFCRAERESVQNSFTAIQRVLTLMLATGDVITQL